MTKDDVLFGYRQQLFAEAARTNVSAACRTFGVHRSTYYAWKHQVDRHGLEMLRPRERRRPKMPSYSRPDGRRRAGAGPRPARLERQVPFHRSFERKRPVPWSCGPLSGWVVIITLIERCRNRVAPGPAGGCLHNPAGVSP